MKITLNEVYSFSDKGVRPRQEDARYPDTDSTHNSQNVFCVCDGVGGSNHGDLASSTVASHIGKAMQKYGSDTMFTIDHFRKVLDQAYDALDSAASHSSDSNMATTLTFLSFNANGVTMAHIGDSRIYHLRKNSGVLYRTEDHSLVSQMVHYGSMTPEEAANSNRKNVITRCMEPIASDETRSMATFVQTTDVQSSDLFFLCSDGVYGYMDEDEMLDILFSDALTNEAKMEELQKKCVANSKDNFTATLVSIANIENSDATPENLSTESSTTMRLPSTDRVYAEVESNPRKHRNIFERLFGKSIFLFAAICTLGLLSPCNNANAQTSTSKVSSDSIAILKGKATEGNIAAQIQLAEWYFAGAHGLPADTARALKYWAQAADKGDAEAIGRMADCYRHGWATDRDSITATKLYEAALKKGNDSLWNRLDQEAREQNSLFCALLLSECCQKGYGTKRTSKQSIDYQKIAASQGHIESQFEVGLYNLNFGDRTEALHWFERAAETEHPGALYYSGLLYFRGQGTDVDKQKGIDYYQRAVALDFPMAYYQLGRILIEGDGMEANPEQGFILLQKAAYQKNAQAMWQLGMCYIDGIGTPRDYYMGTLWLAASHSSHTKELKSLLSDKKYDTYINYLRGWKDFNNSDYIEAVQLFQSVKKSGNIEGLTMLGTCYCFGDSTILNERRAFKNIKKAARRSYCARAILSQLYLHGHGTKRNAEKGLQLLSEAAAYGIPDALCHMGNLYMNNTVVDQDLQLAASLFLRAEAAHCLTRESARLLADCYRMGIDIIPDLDKAEERISELENYGKNKDIKEMFKLLD